MKKKYIREFLDSRYQGVKRLFVLTYDNTAGNNQVSVDSLKRSGGFFNTGKSILLMDSAKSHLGDEVEQAFTDVSSSIKIIHGEIKVSGYSRKQTI